MPKVLKAEDVVGGVYPTNNGGDCVIVEYKGWDAVTVKFLDEFGAKVTTQFTNIRSGAVANPYRKSLYGVGFLGEGKYKSKKGNKFTPEYIAWRGMLERVYCGKRQKNYPTYIGCTVCEEWHNFQVFAEWYCNHESYGLGYDLDKDILVKGNKHYSPETCCLVPQEINCIFNTCGSLKRDLPLGVGYKKEKNMYYASIRNEGVLKHLGYFTTKEEAHEVYREHKQIAVKNVALSYEGLIEAKVFDMLMFWTLD